MCTRVNAELIATGARTSRTGAGKLDNTMPTPGTRDPTATATSTAAPYARLRSGSPWLGIVRRGGRWLVRFINTAPPFGVASLRIALFALWPFRKTVVKRQDAGLGAGIGNVLWFLLCGWWLAIGHLVTGILLCVTVIGIPLGLANFKLIPVSLLPMGREIVDIDRARALGLAPTVAVPADPSARR